MKWEQWQNEPQPTESIEQWKVQGLFNNGIALVMGNIWRGANEGKYLCCVDSDNLKGIQEICTNSKTGITKRLDEFAQITLVEQHNDDLNRARFLFYL